MTDSPAPTLRRSWSQRQRYGFLEQRLYWEGSINRSDLAERFGISAPQASDDIANYMNLAPGSIELDRSRKAFVATDRFVPRFVAPNARHYLTQLLLLADEAMDSTESWLGWIPAHAAIPRVRRRLVPETLRPIVDTIHSKRALDITYQSMRTRDPVQLRIAPHALVYDGARWHARSWCYDRSQFNDFVLARILAIGSASPSSVDSALDREWQEFFTMELAPHPDLSESQRQAIELDYGMHDGLIGIPMRLCMTQYFERSYGLDLQNDSLPLWRRQVILRNRSELEQMRSTLGNDRDPV